MGAGSGLAERSGDDRSVKKKRGGDVISTERWKAELSLSGVHGLILT